MIEVNATERAILAAVARREVVAAVRGEIYDLPAEAASGRLGELGASFVTLHSAEKLRGCIGSIAARRALGEDVAANARAAALADVRFEPIAVDELSRLTIEISVLSPLSPLPSGTREELLAALRPGIDGLVLELGSRRATFLPAVWAQLPAARDFVVHLLRKADLPADLWTPTILAQRYSVESIAAGAPLTGV